MKITNNLRISATIFFCVSCLSVLAQIKEGPAIVEVDTLTKVIGALFTAGGFLVAYLQLKMANQINDVKIKFNADLHTVKDELHMKIDNVEEEVRQEIKSEVGKVQTEVKLSQKEIEARMATHHDIANMRALNTLQGEVTNEKLTALKEQLQHATDLAAATAKAASQAAAEAVREILKDKK